MGNPVFIRIVDVCVSKKELQGPWQNSVWKTCLGNSWAQYDNKFEGTPGPIMKTILGNTRAQYIYNYNKSDIDKDGKLITMHERLFS